MAWAAEIDARVRDVKEGRVKLVPVENAAREVRSVREASARNARDDAALLAAPSRSAGGAPRGGGVYEARAAAFGEELVTLFPRHSLSDIDRGEVVHALYRRDSRLLGS